MLYHLISQPEDILKKTNSTINQANVKLKEFNRSTSRDQKKKKNSKIHSKPSEQHEKKKIQIYQYILIQIWKRIKKKQISSSRPQFK